LAAVILVGVQAPLGSPNSLPLLLAKVEEKKRRDFKKKRGMHYLIA